MTEHRAIDPGEHRVFADASRVAVLETVRQSDRPLDTRAIAEAVGLHVNTVRAHLALLAERGLVTVEPESRDRPGRPRMLYSTREKDNGWRDYRILAEALVAHISGMDGDRTQIAIAAGHAQGVRISGRPEHPVSADEAVHRVVEVLRECGFRPYATADRRRIVLHHCPFGELTRTCPEVVCGVHLGVVRGVLSGLRAPIEAVGLHPFAEPGRCVAELRPARRRAKTSSPAVT